MSDEGEVQGPRLDARLEVVRLSVVRELRDVVRDLGCDPGRFRVLAEALEGAEDPRRVLWELRDLRRALAERLEDGRREARRRVLSGRLP